MSMRPRLVGREGWKLMMKPGKGSGWTTVRLPFGVSV
jgi:hypothetical protein